MSPVFMARPAPTSPHAEHGLDAPDFWSAIWEALTTQRVAHYERKQAAHKVSVKASTGACAAAQYHGMHGRPCAFSGGTDRHCPKGTIGGWYWTYETSVGVYCYVDCCGGRALGNIWCNWSSEPNWCMGGGRAAANSTTDYNCTLAIPEKDITFDGGFVAGID